MKLHLPSRLCLGAAFVLLFASAPAFARGRGQRAGSPPVPRAQRAQPPSAAVRPGPNAAARPGPNAAARPGANIAARPAENQEHLQRWMDNHSNLSLPEMQKALKNEPSFRDYPQQTQQYELNQLARLYNMDPQQRSRMLDRNEGFERLTPPQRQQFLDAEHQWSALPPARRRVLSRVFLDLREMPPDQRQPTLNSPAFRAQFSNDERTMLSTLLTVEPYTPRTYVPAPAPTPAP
jgi:hypothetical protein